MEKHKEVTVCSMNGRRVGQIPTPQFALSKIHGDRNKNIGKSKLGEIRKHAERMIKINEAYKSAQEGSKNAEPITVSRKRFGGYRILLN